jgi:bacterioferritin (cytochrome b1)
VVSSEDQPSASRRGLLRATGAAVVAGAAGLIAACGSASHSSSQATVVAPGNVDVDVLNHALDLKHYMIAAYTAATPYLGGRARAAGKKFLAEELSHASALISLIQKAGGTPNSPQSSYQLGHPHSRKAILRLLQSAEDKMIATLIDTIPEVTASSSRTTLASMVANDAQHVSVLRLNLREAPIPSPFVTGRE